MALAVSGLSPMIMTVRMPMARSSSKRSLIATEPAHRANIAPNTTQPCYWSPTRRPKA